LFELRDGLSSKIAPRLPKLVPSLFELVSS